MHESTNQVTGMTPHREHERTHGRTDRPSYRRTHLKQKTIYPRNVFVRAIYEER